MSHRQSLIDPFRLRDRLVNLVRIPSLTGHEDSCTAQIARWLRDEGGVHVEHWRDGMREILGDPRYPGHEVERSSLPLVAGVARGTREGPTVMLTGHTDVVPTANVHLWDRDPFSGAVVDGRVWGRGASDMKSGLVAALEAFLTFANGNRDFPGRVVFVAVPAEEDSGLGTLAAIRRDWVADAAIIPEPTVHRGVPELVVAQAGAMTVTIEVPGRGAHASKRLEGKSALDSFMLIHEQICRHERENNESETHPMMSALDLPYPNTISTIKGGDWNSTVMDWLEVNVRVAVALNETVDQAFERFCSAVHSVTSQDPWLRDHPPKIRRGASGFGSSATPTDHPLVQALASAAVDVFSKAPELVGVPYGCDMAGWVRHAQMPTVLYGPGSIELAHAPNEWVSLDTTLDTSRVLVGALESLLRLDAGELRQLGSTGSFAAGA